MRRRNGRSAAEPGLYARMVVSPRIFQTMGKHLNLAGLGAAVDEQNSHGRKKAANQKG